MAGDIPVHVLQVPQDRPPEPARHPGRLAVNPFTGMPPEPLLLHVTVRVAVLSVPLDHDKDVCVEEMMVGDQPDK